MKIPTTETLNILINIITVLIEAAIMLILRLWLRPVHAIHGRRGQGHAGTASPGMAALPIGSRVGKIRGPLPLLARAPEVFQLVHRPVFVGGPGAAVGVLLPSRRGQ